MDMSRWFTPFSVNHDDKITSVQLLLTPEEWCSCCQKDGDRYVGPCCGNMSEVQDIMNHAFREGGWVRVDELDTMANLMRSHDSWCEEDLPDPLDPKVLDEDPWVRVIAAWETVKGSTHTLAAYKPRPLDPTVLKDAIRIASAHLHTLDWWIMYFGTDPTDDDKHPAQVMRADLLYKLVPALNTIHDKIMEADFGPVDGIAMCEPGTDKILNLRRGLAIFPTQDKADAVAEYWRKEGVEVAFRPVSVSAQHGVVFNDQPTGEVP